MKFLISSFGPFAGMQLNSSQQLGERLQLKRHHFDIETVILPVSFERSIFVLKSKIDQIKPDAVIATGLAMNRKEITPERIAINMIDARIPDNDGAQPVNRKIDPLGPDGIFSSLPIHSMVERAKLGGFAASISDTAGTYVCNCIMYQLLRLGLEIPSGFVHLPPLGEGEAKESSLWTIDELELGFLKMLESF